MNVYEILTAVGLTIVGSVTIAYLTLYFQAKRRRKALFRTLQNEVELNLSLAQQIRLGDIVDLGGCPELHADAYNNIRLAGELSSLKEDIRHELQYTYEMITMLNRRIFRDGGLSGSASPTLDRTIAKLEVLQNRFAKRSDYERSYEDLLRQYIMSQMPTFFFFGLFSIYAYYLARLPIDASDLASNWSIRVGLALLPLGIASIAWAIILFVVALSRRLPKPLERMREKIERFAERKSAPIFYVASMAVFGLSFATTWAALSNTGINRSSLFVIFCIGLALTFGLFVDNMLRVWQMHKSKTKTKNDSTTPNRVV